ncbi:uncharacterized protein Bfra_011842 [Botrytis fragariae]|uniref:Uncharacterized protein n=1 Tax=Botrytis fragariae TaxID=1964551 RepID=A0A8H6EE22_9HELO|nr:uncharacterized protein Bfra_011842 [Botrytis fragariae]KAF5868877.1 hypothetical protein Bfra_011842 [Botrytis fragariae]
MAGKTIIIEVVGRTSRFGRQFHSMTVYQYQGIYTYERSDIIYIPNRTVSDCNMDFAMVTFLSSPNYGPRLD